MTGNSMFTRDFIVKRIEIRVAEIKEEVEAAALAIQRLHKKQAQGDRKWLATMHGKLVALGLGVEAAGPLADNELIEATNEFESRLRNLYHQPTRDSLSYDEKNQLRQLVAENHKLSVELDGLEQALIYLIDHPVEDWSINALQKIGIMQVVKFRLTERKR